MNQRLYLGIGSILLMVILLVLGLSACDKSVLEPTASLALTEEWAVHTLPATNITATSCTLNGEIVGGKAIRWAFVYGTERPITDPAMEATGKIDPKNSGWEFAIISELGSYTGAFHADVKRLTPGTGYYFRAAALRGINWVYAGEIY